MLVALGVIFLAGPAVLPLYLDGANAPAALVSRIDERLHAVLADKGIFVAAAPGPAQPVEARISAARGNLEKGIAAWKALQLDAAAGALASAETTALAVPDSLDAPRILADARLYLGLLALATAKEADADRLFRMVAVVDPDRRLDSKQFPPDTVAAFEKARKAVVAAGFAEVSLAPEGASFFADGKPVSGVIAHLSFGEHLLSATSEIGAVGEKVVISDARAAWRATIAPDLARIESALRAASKRGDESALLHAADLLAGAAGAGRVVLWDLRSVSGRIEAPMRIWEVGSRTAGRSAVADLGTGAAPDPALRVAIASLWAADAPIASRPSEAPRAARKAPGAWVWWTAGGLAILAAGGAAAALAQPGPANTKVAVTVDHP